jgi:diadenosine tetraphosphate (Ap4A) HIT family hydrolase
VRTAAASDAFVYADDLVTVEVSQECGVPGYLVLRLRPPGASLPGLDPAAAARVGAALATAASAIERVVAAERVYLLSFCEVEPQLHFHLFPRTRWLLEASRAGALRVGAPGLSARGGTASERGGGRGGRGGDPWRARGRARAGAVSRRRRPRRHAHAAPRHWTAPSVLSRL